MLLLLLEGLLVVALNKLLLAGRVLLPKLLVLVQLQLRGRVLHCSLLPVGLLRQVVQEVGLQSLLWRQL